MADHIRNGLRAGAIFGVVLLFLILIGFTSTAASLIGNAVNGEGEQALRLGLAIFLALIGLWAGANGAKATKPDTWGRALISGLVAGVIAGLISGLAAYIFGTIQYSGPRVDMRPYLAALSPQAVYTLLFFFPRPLMAGVIHMGLLGASGLLGGILARGVGRSEWRHSLTLRWESAAQSMRNVTVIKTLQRHPAASYVLYGVLLLAVFAAPQFLNNYWNFTLGTIGIYVLLGLGLNIVVGLAGMLDLGYVAFFAVGAYTVGLLTAPRPHNLLWDFWPTVPIALALAALAGVLLGIPVLRLRGDYLAIVTLGFGEIIRLLVKSDALAFFFNGANGLPGVAEPMLFGRPFNSERDFLYLILIAILIVIFITIRLQNSRVGRAWIAIREDETVAQAMGIHLLRYKLLAFGIGAAFAGLGGLIFASRNQFTSPDDLTLMVSINVLAVVIVGGMGSIPGVILGAFALKGLPEVLRELETFRIVAFGALLVVMMIVRPEGLWPSRRRRLEMHEEVTEVAEEEEERAEELALGGETV